MTDPPESRVRGLTVGTRVEVRNQFDGSWTPGFVVEALAEGGYRLQRRGDNQSLPAVLPADDVRRERKTSMWWV